MALRAISNLSDDVAERVVAWLGVHGFLIGVRRVNDGGDVETGATTGERPEKMRTDAQQCLTKQYQRHPLVVGDRSTLMLRDARHCTGHRLIERGVVRATSQTKQMSGFSTKLE